MITLRILKLLEQEGHGTVDIDGTMKTGGLFFEKLPQGKTGVAIYSRGSVMGHGLRYTQAFDLYSRGINDVAGYQILEQIIETLSDSYTVCSLPIVTGIDEEAYSNISIVPVSNIENAGQDDNDRVLYAVTAQVTYTKPNAVIVS